MRPVDASGMEEMPKELSEQPFIEFESGKTTVKLGGIHAYEAGDEYLAHEPSGESSSLRSGLDCTLFFET